MIPETAVPRIIELVKTRIPRRFGLDPIRDIQVLCLKAEKSKLVVLHEAGVTARPPKGLGRRPTIRAPHRNEPDRMIGPNAVPMPEVPSGRTATSRMTTAVGKT